MKNSLLKSPFLANIKCLNHIAIFIGVLLTWFLLYSNTLYSMVEIWWRSNTFAHGFLIFPISFYLLWEKRNALVQIEYKTEKWYLLPLFLLVFIWGVADAVDVLLIKQYLVILMIPFLVGIVFGSEILKTVAFPLFFLLFAVPFGNFLIPKLQYVTGMLSVWGLEVSGIPVFMDGTFISIPEGNFEVAVACSGLKYLIATISLGTLYAYLTYTRLYKRLLFILISIIVSILANGLRAYLIILVAHFSDMEYLTGPEHITFGWVLYGIIIFTFFYIGSFWRDEQEEIVNDAFSSKNTDRINWKNFLVVVAILSVGPLMTYWTGYHGNNLLTELPEPELSGQWVKIDKKQTVWAPEFKNADNVLTTVYQLDSGARVFLYIAQYQFESKDKELVNETNKTFQTDSWMRHSNRSFNLKLQNTSINMKETLLRNATGKLLIWNWYHVLNDNEANPVKIKLAQAIGKITGIDRGGSYIALATTFNDDVIVDSRSRLKKFLLDNFSGIQHSISIGNK